MGSSSTPADAGLSGPPRRPPAVVALAAASLLLLAACGPSEEERRASEALAAYEDEALRLVAADRVSEEGLAALMDDPDLMYAGRLIFGRDCAVCHGDHGQGDIGPNLTDDYWLHGPRLRDIYDIVRLGRPTHGMRAWENHLQPAELLVVSAFAGSLLGSLPADAKEPQGEYAPRAAASTSASAAGTGFSLDASRRGGEPADMAALRADQDRR